MLYLALEQATMWVQQLPRSAADGVGSKWTSDLGFHFGFAKDEVGPLQWWVGQGGTPRGSLPHE